jgi:hypothetical protein
MVHPGRPYAAGTFRDQLLSTRQLEMETLLDPELVLALKNQQIALVNFRKVLEGKTGAKG